MNKQKRLVLAAVVFALVLSVSAAIVSIESQDTIRVTSLASPIEHDPPFLGSHSFIVHYGVLVQDGYAYSYVVIDSTTLRDGDFFVALPSLNVGLAGDYVYENNLTMRVVFHGSPSAVPWINFSLSIPTLKFDWNYSHLGKGGDRSSLSIDGLGGRAEVFAQTAYVVDVGSWFEFYFYIGNSSTPAPSLTQGPPS